MSTSTKRKRPARIPEGWCRDWDWQAELGDEFRAAYFEKLSTFVESERQRSEVYPAAANIFEAFRRTPLANVRVVILGQDPYPNPGQAHGLSFSVRRGVSLPRSLANILRELRDDLGIPFPTHGNLELWADQGVLLLNSVLTVRSGAANSHRGQGWETFTDAAIRAVSRARPFCVFLLWGQAAIDKRSLIDSRHARFCSPHPSPLSAHRGFIGSRVFSRCNQALVENGLSPIAW